MRVRNSNAPRVSLPIDGHVVFISASVYDRLVAVAAERGATLDEFTRALFSRDRKYTDAAAWGDVNGRNKRARSLIGESIQPSVYHQ